MTRTLVDIDDEALAAAAAELGTTTKVETVNRALAEIAARPRRLTALERLRTAEDDLGGRGRHARSMALSKHLADKSAFEQQRHSEAAAGLLRALTADGALYMTEIVALELLYSARNPDDYETPLGRPRGAAMATAHRGRGSASARHPASTRRSRAAPASDPGPTHRRDRARA